MHPDLFKNLNGPATAVQMFLLLFEYFSTIASFYNVSATWVQLMCVSWSFWWDHCICFSSDKLVSSI